MRNRRWIWLWLVIVIAGAAVIPPVLFGKPREIVDQKGGDPWRNILFDFQTLITGVAAVTAATWTISVMEKTDARQEQRHRELVELSLRSDRLKVERMLYPQFGELREAYKELRDVPDWLLWPDDNLVDVALFELRVKPVLMVVSRVESILSRSVWTAAEPLFGGFLTANLIEVREALATVVDQVEKTRKLVNSADHFALMAGTAENHFIKEFALRELQELGPEKGKEEFNHIGSTARRAAEKMEPVFQDLYKLADQYGIPG